jgi:hypothetical protein
MAKQSLQDKFQTSYPYKQEDDEGKTWQWAKDGALRPRPASGGVASTSRQWPDQTPPVRDPVPYVSEVAASCDPPTWTDMREWVIKENGGMKLHIAAQTDVSKVQSPNALCCGFTLHDMDSVDDQYTGENQDHFYGIVVGPDDAGNKVEGFVERNNYLDRL